MCMHFATFFICHMNKTGVFDVGENKRLNEDDTTISVYACLRKRGFPTATRPVRWKLREEIHVCDNVSEFLLIFVSFSGI